MSEKPTLRQARLARSLSTGDLARKADLASGTISSIEAGKHPRLSTIRKLSEALGVAPQDIAWPGDPFGESSA